MAIRQEQADRFARVAEKLGGKFDCKAVAVGRTKSGVL